MLTSSSNFTAAATGGQVTRTPLELSADWAVDGHGAAGSIDDLSGWVQQVKIAHGFDDGFPSPVHHETPEPGASATLSAQVAGSMRASRYFSPFAGSAVSSYDRDRAPIRIRTGLVTSAGAEQITVFNGQMSELPISTDQAALNAISAARFKLTQVVTLPAVSRSFEGLNANWPISFALATCGVYVSPPPRSGCRLWMPMHGSLHPFIPAANGLLNDQTSVFVSSGNDGDYPIFRLTGEVYPPQDGHHTVVSIEAPSFVDGPYLQGLYAHAGSSAYHDVVSASGTPIRLGAGDAFLSQSQNRGRVEFWVRGDSCDTIGTPLSATTSAVHFTYTLASGQIADVGVNISTRKVFCRVFDGTHDVTVSSTAAVPTDGLWHSVGGAWDVAAGKQWTYLDGVVESNSTAIVTGGLPVTEDVDAFGAGLFATILIPVAEVQITSGADASPTLTPTWIGDTGYFTPGAVISPSQLELEALAEPPTEAFTLLEMYGSAEYAWLRFDESDLLLYYPLGWWAQSAQQQTVDALDTQTNIGSVALNSDPKRVVNTCVVSYNQTTVPDPYGTLRDYVLQTSDVYLIPPGVSTLTLGLDTPAVGLTTYVANGDALAVANGGGIIGPADAAVSFVTLNLTVSGTEAYANAAQVAVSVIEWTPTQVTLQFDNKTSSVWYTANSSSGAGAACPTIGILGVAVSARQVAVVAQETTSVGVRGIRGAQVSLPAIQREDMAVRAARRIVLEHAVPEMEVGDLRVFADPRRQPGDLVTLADTADTGVSGTFRVLSVQHTINQSDYTQTVKLVVAPTVGYWGTAVWGESMWGDPET